MLLAIIACALGIAVENLRWPQDRSEAKERFAAAEGLGESAVLLIGLVLGHSVVRWLLALAVAGKVVSVVLGSPEVFAAVKAAKDANRISVAWLDVLSGLAITALMCALALAARRLAR